MNISDGVHSEKSEKNASETLKDQSHGTLKEKSNFSTVPHQGATVDHQPTSVDHAESSDDNHDLLQQERDRSRSPRIHIDDEAASSQNRAPTETESVNLEDLFKDLPSDDEGNAHQSIQISFVNGSFNLFAPNDEISRLSLREIVFRLRFAEYGVQNAHLGIIYRNASPPFVARILETGRVIVLGTKSIEACRHASKIITKLISKVGYPNVRCYKFRIDSLHCTANIGHPIRLEAVYEKNKEVCQYEPQVMNSCVFRMEDPKLTFRIYVTGKITVDGGRAYEEVERGYQKLFPILFEDTAYPWNR